MTQFNAFNAREILTSRMLARRRNRIAEVIGKLSPHGRFSLDLAGASTAPAPFDGGDT